MTPQAVLRRATGLNLAPAVAERAVAQRMAQCAAADAAAYLGALGGDELAQLIELVIVPESWLFRDAPAFYAAADCVRARWPRPARILSLPCAGGEEAYSIAMALFDAGLPAAAFSIDAIDLSHACIARARAGVYGRNAFRNQDLGFRERYFTPLGGGEYRVADALRAQVRFSQGNLLQLDGACRGPYDVVFCRNLLIYFDQPTTAAAAAILAGLLADDGTLFAGYAEVPAFCRHGFTQLPLRLAFGLAKKSAPAALAAPAPAPVRPPARAPRPARPARAAAPAQPMRKPAAAAPAVPPAPPALPDSALAQARRLADLGRFAEAGERCRAHLAAVPDAADAYFILGMLDERAGQSLLAEQHWRRCLYLQPDHYDALCHLALLAGQHGRPAEAQTLQARAARVFQRSHAEGAAP